MGPHLEQEVKERRAFVRNTHAFWLLPEKAKQMNYGITNELFIGYCSSKHPKSCSYSSIHISLLVYLTARDSATEAVEAVYEKSWVSLQHST